MKNKQLLSLLKITALLMQTQTYSFKELKIYDKNWIRKKAKKSFNIKKDKYNVSKKFKFQKRKRNKFKP